MKRIILIIALLLVAVILAGCAPVLTVENNTKFEVTVFISGPEGPEVLSPSPGESSSAEIPLGNYSVTVVPAQQWIDYAKATRQYLNSQLANAQNLTGPQLSNIVQRLKDISAKIQQYEATGGTGGSCAGKLTQDSNAVVMVSAAADGSLVVSCGSSGSNSVQ
jgi:hypothetical protein